jgi:very-short-patch-repair endonuclease
MSRRKVGTDEGNMRNRFVSIARKLRKTQTPQEAKLWSLLRAKRFEGLKFRRQYPIGKYIVDFCCWKKKLIIELDGGGHNEARQIEYDHLRDRYLRSQGYKILRVWNFEVDENLRGVYEEIFELIDE